MTREATNEWRSLSQDFARLQGRLDRVRSVNVNAADVRKDVAQVAQRYLQMTRQVLLAAGLEGQSATLDDSFSALLQLSEGRNALASYKKHAKRIRKTIPSVTAGLALHAGSVGERKELSADEKRLTETLAKLVPTAAVSYRQALPDMQDDTRVSFRGPALELREVLREVLDNLAPDKDVMASDGYTPQKDHHGRDRTTPTMKQKVRFILKARDRGGSSRGTAETSAETVDAMVADVTRSVYNMGSLSTHVAGERRAVEKLKRYVDAVLHDLLEH